MVWEKRFQNARGEANGWQMRVIVTPRAWALPLALGFIRSHDPLLTGISGITVEVLCFIVTLWWPEKLRKPATGHDAAWTEAAKGHAL